MMRSKRYFIMVLCALVLLVPCTAGAVSYVNEIGYTLNEEELTATVTHGPATDQPVNIPETIEVDGKEYTVAAIGENAFDGQPEVLLPKTVRTIAANGFKDVPAIKLVGDTTTLTIAQGAITYTPDPEAEEDAIYTVITVPAETTVILEGESELPAGVLLKVEGTLEVEEDAVFVNYGSIEIVGVLNNRGTIENKGTLTVVQVMGEGEDGEEDQIVSTGTVNNENSFVNAGTLDNNGEWTGEDAVVPITITVTGNGAVVIKDGEQNIYTETVPYGTQITITAANQTGFKVDRFVVNEENKVSPYTLTAKSEIIIDATFVECTQHSEIVTDEQKPTCDEEGSRTHTCTLCGAQREEVLAANGHKYSDKWTIDRAATCTKAGEKSRHCIYCDEARTDITVIKAQHSYYRTLSQEPTCTEDGLSRYTCKRCGSSYSVTIKALGHDYDEEFTVDVEPTCTTDGSKSRHCANCGQQIEVTIIEAEGHKLTDWIIDEQATYEAAGSMHKECTVCQEIVETQEIAKLQYTEEDLALEGVDVRFTAGQEGEIHAPTVQPANPQEGDVRFVAAGWTLGEQHGEIVDGKILLTPELAGEQTLEVRYEKQVYTNGIWLTRGDAAVQAVLQVQEAEKTEEENAGGIAWWWWLILLLIILLLILLIRKLAASSRRRKRIRRLREM